MAINKLGKGLAALLQDLADEEIKKEELSGNIESNSNNQGFKNIENNQNSDKVVYEIDISLIDPNPNQPRKNFDNTALRELASSIKTYGILQPLILVKIDSRYIIVAGERRYRAAKIAELKKVPAIVKELSQQNIKEIAIIENLQREDLNPIEAAEAIKELMTTYKMTQEELAQKLGKSRPTITNLLRLLNLSNYVISLVRADKLSAGHARTIVSIDNKEIQEKLADTVIQTQMSVRELENQVKIYTIKGILTDFNTNKKPKEKKSKELREMINSMKRIFSTKVKIIGNDEKGRICIDYFNRDDLDRIHSLLEILKNQKINI